MLHPGYVRNYEPVLDSLLERGHEILLVFNQPKKQQSDEIAERLAERHLGRLQQMKAPRRSDGWRDFAWALRGFTDLARFLDPVYEDAVLLRDRVESRLRRGLRKRHPLTAVIGLTALWLLRRLSGRRASRLVMRFFTALERVVPPCPDTIELLRRVEPDAVLVTPLVNVASEQVEFVKSARVLGVPSALCVASWDNLTNKGLIRVEPDRIIVWNGLQVREAVELHGVPAEKLVVTGAQRFDEWFVRKPSTTHEEFCNKVGLPADSAFVLYLCSSPFIAPDEVTFVRRWLSELREHPLLRDIGVLIRPHPQNAKQWRDVGCDEFGNVVIWPRAGAQPVSEDSKADFYDSLHHCLTIVGINTSALIEGGIVGKTVHTVLDPQFTGTQEGTLHFRYLLSQNGGLLRVALDLVNHVAQLSDAGLGGVEESLRTQEFVRSFIRPHGLDVPATPLVVEAVETLTELSAAPWRDGSFARIVRTVLVPLLRAQGALDVAGKATGVLPGEGRSRELEQDAARSVRASAPTRRRGALREVGRSLDRRSAPQWARRARRWTKRLRTRVPEPVGRILSPLVRLLPRAWR